MAAAATGGRQDQDKDQEDSTCWSIMKTMCELCIIIF